MTPGLSAQWSVGSPFGRRPSLIIQFSTVGQYTLLKCCKLVSTYRHLTYRHLTYCTLLKAMV